jgi:hypothetical protein
MNKHSFNIPIIFIGLGILVYSTWIFELVLNPHLSLTQSYVSELSVHGQPYATYFQVANLLGSSCMFIGFFILLRRFRKTEAKATTLFLWAMSIITLIGIVNAIFPMNCAPSQSHSCLVAQDQLRINFSQWVHQSSAIIMFSGLLFSQLYSTFYIFKRHTTLFWLSLVNVMIQFLLNIAISVVSVFEFRNIGVFQRLSLMMLALWILAILYTLKNRPNVFLEQV